LPLDIGGETLYNDFFIISMKNEQPIRKDAVETLEFRRVLETTATFCLGSTAREEVMGILPLSGKDEIMRRFSLIREIRRLMHEEIPLGLLPYEDISDLMEKSSPEGAILEGVELLRFLPVLESIEAVISVLAGHEELRNLGEFCSGLTGFPHLLRALDRSVETDGGIKDTASHELQEIRTRIRSLEKKITRRLERITRDSEVSGFLQDDFITKRSGRWVIPVRMDSKGMVEGVVHDVSRTGETAFMEPLEIIGLSNELENLIAEARAEEIRILKHLTGMVRADAGGISSQSQSIVYLDVLHAIASLAEKLRMEEPEINTRSVLRLAGSRHPLLALHKEHNVVPLDLSLGGEHTSMVITGPNAGGKTIALKTAGLLTLMALSGMPVPADPASSFPLLDTVLVDIGDEQSIDADLSTFSAHVSNISSITERAGPQTMVLMDELGTGTDPQQGAAIGCAVLKDLRDRGALTIATTHLVDIMAFTHRTTGMLNAAMDFNQETLTPLYRLVPGEPGQSHALETAEKFGLPHRILDNAKAFLGTSQAEFQSLLAELKERRIAYQSASEKLSEQRTDLEKRELAMKDRISQAEAEHDSILEQAYREASTLVTDIRRKVYDILEEAKREKSRSSLKELEKTGRQIEVELRKFQKEEPSLSISEIHEGGRVFVKSIGRDAEVIAVLAGAGRLRVRAGEKELELPVSSVGPSREKEPERGVTYRVEHREPSSDRITLIGQRVDEALDELEPFLNQASLAGLREVVVIHGMGTGALRRAVRKHLDGHPLVESFRQGEQAEGGAGVTIVRLK
jgi:DNA mismatch repair protein MutS2